MKVLRFPQVSEITGLSRMAIWRLEKDNQFPKRIELTRNTVGWIEQEIIEWLENRPRVMGGEDSKPNIN